MTSLSDLPPEIVAHVIGVAASGDVAGLVALCQSHPIFRSLCAERIVRRSSLRPIVERFLPSGPLVTPVDVVRAHRAADHVRRCVRYAIYSLLMRRSTGEARSDRLSFDEFVRVDSVTDVLASVPRWGERLLVQGSDVPGNVRSWFYSAGQEAYFRMIPIDPAGPARALINAMLAGAIVSSDDVGCADVDLLSVFPGAAAYVRQAPPGKFLATPTYPARTLFLSVDLDGILNDPASPAYRP